MADIVLNGAKGRLAEIFDDGANLQIIPLSAVDIDANLKDGYTANAINIAAVLGDAANTEQTGSTWVRKAVSNASVSVAVDYAADKAWVTVPDQTWTAPLAANDVVAILIAEDTGTDASDRVLLKADFVVTTDGNDVTADFSATTGFWQAS